MAKSRLKPPSPKLANYGQEQRRLALEGLREKVQSGVDLHPKQLVKLDVAGLVEYVNVNPGPGRDRQVADELLRRAENKIAKKAAKEAAKGVEVAGRVIELQDEPEPQDEPGDEPQDRQQDERRAA